MLNPEGSSGQVKAQPETYFEVFRDGGVVYLESLIGTGEEDLWLEFKVVETKDGRPSEKDKQQFAKAASAFANADGGLIVWGVHAKADAESPDVVRGLFPLKNADEFKRNLAAHEGQLVNPPVVGIRHELIPGDQPGTGYVLSLIPGSNTLHMARGKDQHCFFLRSGSATHKMEAFEIQSRYGQAPHPVLDVLARIESAGHSSSGNRIERNYKLVFSVRNKGQGACRHPALRIAALKGFEELRLEWPTRLETGFIHRSSASHLQQQHARLYAGPDVLVFPNSQLDVVSLTVIATSLSGNLYVCPTIDQVVKFELYHEGIPSFGTFQITPDMYMRALNNEFIQLPGELSSEPDLQE